MNKSSVFKSDFLTNDSLVPAFVFCRESQSLTRPAISGIYALHQTSIGINWTAKNDLWQSACHHRVASEYISVPLFRRNQRYRLVRQRQDIQLGCHSEKGQNTIIIWQCIRIVSWSWKIPPINRNEFRIFGPLFLAVVLHVINQEIQIHPCDLS
jgi:hypothetical protein